MGWGVVYEFPRVFWLVKVVVVFQDTSQLFVWVDFIQAPRPSFAHPSHEFLERWATDDDNPTLELAFALFSEVFVCWKSLFYVGILVKTKVKSSPNTNIFRDTLRDVSVSFARYQLIVHCSSDENRLTKGLASPYGIEERVSPDLDILPEVLDALVIVLITRPLRPKHQHFPGALKWVHRDFGQMLDFVDV